VRLDGAGLTVRTSRPERMPGRFRFVCLLPAGDPRFERIALVVQRQLSAVGVDMQIETVSHLDLQRRAAAGDFEALIYEMTSGRTLSWIAAFWHSPAPGGPVYVRNGYRAADEAIDRMRLAGGDEETRIAVADVMRVLRDDPPALFLAWPYEARALERSICVPYEPERDIFGTLWLSRRGTDCVEARR
jgi:ABC-type transport system substrate-binding protein